MIGAPSLSLLEVGIRPPDLLVETMGPDETHLKREKERDHNRDHRTYDEQGGFHA